MVHWFALEGVLRCLFFQAFDADIRAEKEKGFRMDKFLELMTGYISAYDLVSLRELWHHLNTKIFSRLENSHSTTTVAKLETSILRHVKQTHLFGFFP